MSPVWNSVWYMFYTDPIRDIVDILKRGGGFPPPPKNGTLFKFSFFVRHLKLRWQSPTQKGPLLWLVWEEAVVDLDWTLCCTNHKMKNTCCCYWWCCCYYCCYLHWTCCCYCCCCSWWCCRWWCGCNQWRLQNATNCSRTLNKDLASQFRVRGRQ